MEELTTDQVETGALMAATTAAVNYAAPRFPAVAEYAWRFLAGEMIRAAYPFVKVAAYANLADQLRDAGVTEVADEIDAIARRVYPGEGSHDGG